MLARDHARQIDNRRRDRADDSNRRDEPRRGPTPISLFQSISIGSGSFGMAQGASIFGADILPDDSAPEVVGNVGGGIPPTGANLIVFQFDGYLLTQYD